MTCRDIMTGNPSCCTRTETAAHAARIMKSEDVGPVPIVEDRSRNRLVGIVTDRDLAIKVVADGRSPDTVQLDEIMSTGLVTCRPEDDIEEVMQRMADHQVRRIPVVDGGGCLVGIVSQADVARFAEEREVGSVVEEISEESSRLGGFFRAPGQHSYEHSTGSNIAGSLLTAMIGVGIGAGLMYMLDPDFGRRRRAITKDRALDLSKSAVREVNRRARDLGSKASSMMQQEKDETLSDSFERTSDRGAEYSDPIR